MEYVLVVLFVLMAIAYGGYLDDPHPYRRLQYDDPPFLYGVASGDPDHESVTLWTKLFDVDDGDEIVYAVYDENQGESFSSNSTWGSVYVEEDVDYTIRVRVSNLNPKTRYAYRFLHLKSSRYSRLGRTNTAPHPDDESIDRIEMGFGSCSNVASVYLNVYREVALLANSISTFPTNEDEGVPAFFVHLGDTFYWGDGNPFRASKDSCIGRNGENALENVPGIPFQERCEESYGETYATNGGFNESEVLYHARFSWNMLLADIDVKDLRASLPLILAPDDDDLLQAQGMNLTAEPAIRAWHENQPINVEIREDETVFLPRKTNFGTLLEVLVLDTRFVGKEENPPTYLGKEQNAFLDQVLDNNTNYRFRLVLSSQVFATMSLTRRGWIPVFTLIIALIATPLAIGFTACATYKTQSLKLELMDNLKEESDSSVKNCCLSKGCILVMISTLSLMALAWLVLIILVPTVILPADPQTGVTNVQPDRDRAWDANIKDRELFLKKLRDTQQFNNILITGDVHLMMMSNLVDTAPGVTTLEGKPRSTTKYGVEFQSSCIHSENADELIRDYVGDRPVLVSFFVFLFDTLIKRSNPATVEMISTEDGYGYLIFERDKVTAQFRQTPWEDPEQSSFIRTQREMYHDENEWR